MLKFVAHQGGWDEILMVIGPLLLIGFGLWLANRRVNERLLTEQQSGGEATAEEGLAPNHDLGGENVSS